MENLKINFTFEGVTQKSELELIISECEALNAVMKSDSCTRAFINALGQKAAHELDECFDADDSGDCNAVLGGMATQIFNGMVNSTTAIFKNAIVKRHTIPGKYVICAGSRICGAPKPSCPPSTKLLFNQLVDNGDIKIIPNSNVAEVINDIVTDSVSGTASLISGNSVNGNSTKIANIAW